MQKLFQADEGLGNRSEVVKGIETKVKIERRGKTDLIAEILVVAKRGTTISALAEKVGNVSTVNRYLPPLLKRGLIRLEKTGKYFLSTDGREYGVLYFTTKKGFMFLKWYTNLLALLSKDD